jgi:hypothetical protein
MDSLSEALTLQNELNEAVSNEDYKTASQLRDRLAVIKVRSINHIDTMQRLVCQVHCSATSKFPPTAMTGCFTSPAIFHAFGESSLS